MNEELPELVQVSGVHLITTQGLIWDLVRHWSLLLCCPLKTLIP